MQRAILIGTILGAALLGVGCTNNDAPATSTVFPHPVVATMEPEGPTSRLTGFSVDPEAYFLNLAACGQTCPFPPVLNDQIPLFNRSVVRNMPVLAMDAATNQPAGPPTTTSNTGMWTLTKIPSREGPPFIMLAPGGQGTLGNDAPSPLPLPPVPEGNYVPTLTLRPVATTNSICVGLEADPISDKGVLEAVAKFLSLPGPEVVTVGDLLNPAKFGGVMVIFLYHPGFPYLRAPATDTAVEASSGQVLNVQWAPPGALPPELAPLQSTRGFFVAPGAPTSQVGIVVVVHPAGSPMTPVKYSPKDEKEDMAEQRPWFFPPLETPPAPGVVLFAGLQFMLPGAVPPSLIPPTSCFPRQ